MDDAALIERAREGSEDAIAELFGWYLTCRLAMGSGDRFADPESATDAKPVASYRGSRRD